MHDQHDIKPLFSQYRTIKLGDRGVCAWWLAQGHSQQGEN